jgi:replicative DNA helicase
MPPDGRPVDILTVVEELKRHKELEAVGREGYIAGLVDGVPDQPNIEYYVRMDATMLLGDARPSSR